MDNENGSAPKKRRGRPPTVIRMLPPIGEPAPERIHYLLDLLKDSLKERAKRKDADQSEA